MNSYKEPLGSLEKAFKLLEIICIEKEFNSRLIADKMNCDIRTARRYIEKIKYLFEDLIEVGKGYKYRWKGIPEIDKKILKSSNLHLLFAFIELGSKIGKDKNFWKEIKKSLSKGINNEIMGILFGSVLEYEKIEDKKVKIEKAINGDKCIKFKYLRYNKYFEVEPLKIVLWEGFWYLIISDPRDNKFKTLALDLIEDIKIIEDSAFEKTKKLKELEEQLKEAENIFHIGGNRPIEVEIIIFSSVSEYFERRKILHEQKIIKKFNNGDILINFKAIGEDDFKMQLFSWIPHFKVLKPEEYKNYFVTTLKESLNAHGNFK